MCKAIDHPSLAKGWGCCQTNCNTYNSDMREECKFCGHKRCGEQPKVKEVIYEKPNGGVVLQRVKVPDGKGLN